MGTEEDLAAIKAGVDELRNADKDALSRTFKVIGNLSNIAGLLSGPGALIQLVSIVDQLFGGVDATAKELQDIEGLLKVTFRFEQSEAEHTKMQLVNSTVSDIRSSLQAILQESLPYSEASLDTLQTTTLSKLNAFDHDDQDSYWTRAYFDELVYSDHWFGRVMPDGIVSSRSGQQYVFDYRLTLPGYLKSIAVRSAAISILIATGFIQKQPVLEEIRARTDAIARSGLAQAEGFYDRILAGLIMSRTPRLSEIAYIDEGVIGSGVPNYLSVFEPAFVLTPRPMGAILSYDGVGIVDSYPNEYPNLAPSPFGVTPNPKGPLLDVPPYPAEYLRFAARYALGSRKRAKQLYAKIGLDQAWATIQVLRIQAGIIPQFPDPMQNSSVREIYSDLGTADAEIINVPPGSPPPNVSLWDVVRRLAEIGNVDNSHLLFVSMRAALDAATP
jgi:hypothetical protein